MGVGVGDDGTIWEMGIGIRDGVGMERGIGVGDGGTICEMGIGIRDGV